MSEQQQECEVSRQTASEPQPQAADGDEAVAAEAGGEIMRVTLANAQVTPAQARALVALSQGLSLGEAAVAGEVDRGTLYRWRTADRNFISVLNAWRQEQQAAARDSLLSLTRKARNAVSRELDAGNGRLGLRVLDKLGSAQIGPTGPTHPRDIFGPGMEQDEADKLWHELKETIMGIPQERRVEIGSLIRCALRVEELWGVMLLVGLALSEQSQPLDKEQADRAGAMILVQLRQEAAARAIAGQGAL